MNVYFPIGIYLPLDQSCIRKPWKKDCKFTPLCPSHPVNLHRRCPWSETFHTEVQSHSSLQLCLISSFSLHLCRWSGSVRQVVYLTSNLKLGVLISMILRLKQFINDKSIDKHIYKSKQWCCIIESLQTQLQRGCYPRLIRWPRTSGSV